MKTAEVSRPIWGDELYQIRARAALPLLIRQAKLGNTIYYSDLADELEMPNARNLNYVLGCIGTTLIELGEEYGEEIPNIQCLVVNQTTGIPGSGFDWFIERKEFKNYSKRQKRELIQAELKGIYTYEHWQWVLKCLNLKEYKFPKTALPKRKSSSGESRKHKELKKFIANNPSAIGLTGDWSNVEMEYKLPSGDSVDVMFSRGKQCVAVEVKSSISDTADIHRGIFQAVKYQHVTEAMLIAQGKNHNVRSILVLEGDFPESLLHIKSVLGVKVVSNIKPSKRK